MGHSMLTSLTDKKSFKHVENTDKFAAAISTGDMHQIRDPAFLRAQARAKAQAKAKKAEVKASDEDLIVDSGALKASAQAEQNVMDATSGMSKSMQRITAEIDALKSQDQTQGETVADVLIEENNALHQFIENN